MSKEKPKRLQTTREVLRNLYLKSGNQCAFPGCSKPLINDNGDMLGQVCHIDAAKPGGPRYNPNQPKEKRRAFSNLLLLCYDHHKITDDEDEYPVERMKQIKEQHESKFGDPINKLVKTISDITIDQEYKKCRSLSKLIEVMDWKSQEDDTKKIVSAFNKQLRILKDLTPNDREVLAIMLSKSRKNDEVLIQGILDISSGSNEEKQHSIVRLIEHEILTELDTNHNGQLICSFKQTSSVDIWGCIKDFCSKTGTSESEIITDMNFAIMD